MNRALNRLQVAGDYFYAIVAKHARRQSITVIVVMLIKVRVIRVWEVKRLNFSSGAEEKHTHLTDE